MKLKIGLILVLLFGTAFGQTRENEYNQGSFDLNFDYRTSVGSNTTLTADTASLLGANDTLVTRWFPTEGDFAVSLIDTGGSTISYSVIVEASIIGTSTSADSAFKPIYSLDWTGNYLDNAKVSTSSTPVAITKLGQTPPIFVPALMYNRFRFMLISGATHVGDTFFQKLRIKK